MAYDRRYDTAGGNWQPAEDVHLRDEFQWQTDPRMQGTVWDWWNKERDVSRRGMEGQRLAAQGPPPAQMDLDMSGFDWGAFSMTPDEIIQAREAQRLAAEEEQKRRYNEAAAAAGNRPTYQMQSAGPDYGTPQAPNKTYGGGY
jgi:hypothetical protein